MSPEEAARQKASKALEAKIDKEAKAEQAKIKLLLLGAGESGKSTIFKQMKLIYGVAFTDAERKQQAPLIFSNVVVAMKNLCEMSITYDMAGGIACKDAFDKVRAMDENDPITVDTGDAIKALWNDPGLKLVWDRRAEFQLVESVQFYFNKIDTIKQPTYVPTEEDILFSRIRTTGIVTERYVIDGSTFEMYDVGGQRNERKKWIHCFEGVTAVIFVAAISEYDQKLFEDASTNRMVEALELFEDICNNAFFVKSSMILFLNKIDLFESKIKKVHIRDSPQFADYAGPECDMKAGADYFLGKFQACNRTEGRMIYNHMTCATDTKNVKVVFNACKDIILRQNLQSTGFMD